MTIRRESAVWCIFVIAGLAGTAAAQAPAAAPAQTAPDVTVVAAPT